MLYIGPETYAKLLVKGYIKGNGTIITGATKLLSISAEIDFLYYLFRL